MNPAAKHFDPVIGIDIHIIQPPGPVPPVPVPHPFIGFILDPMDYLPIVGSTVNINGLPRALAGTQGVCMPPHIPIGGIFVKPPANECEMFMGSATVNCDGDALSYMGLPALSCHCIGMPPIPRLRKKGAIKSLVLPTSNVLPIPAGPPVLVGGPPTISLMAMAMKFGMAALGKAMKKFMKSKLGKKLQKKIKDLKTKIKDKVPCLTGHPVNTITGANVDEFVDFDHPNFPALKWKRFYNSNHSDEDIPIGRGFRHGWQHELRFLKDRVEYRSPDGDTSELPLPELLGEIDPQRLLSAADKVWGSQYDGLILRGSPETSWTLSGIHQPTLKFNKSHSGEFRLEQMEIDGVALQMLYDEENRLVGSQSDDNSGLRFEYDRQNRLIDVQLVNGKEKQAIANYDYGKDNCMTRWTDALGAQGKFEYDSEFRMTRNTDRLGYSYFYEFDSKGRCIHTFGQDGLYDVRIEYFPDDHYTLAKFGDGAETQYHYDENGALTKIIDATGGLTLFEIDEAGNVGKQIDPNGDETTYVYNAVGGNVGRVDASGQWLLPFDLQPHRPNGLAYQLPSSPEGWMVGDQAIESQLQTDSISTQLAQLTAAPEKLKKPIERLEKPEAEYDQLGRTILERFHAGKQQTIKAYDANGNLTSRVDEDGSRWGYRYTSWNLLEEERYPTGASIQYKYNIREEISEVRDGGGTETFYERDKCDRLTAVHRGGKLRERYVYNSNGSFIEKYDANGDCLLKFEPGPYDTHAAIELKDGPKIEFKHDEFARVVAASDGVCQLSRKYSPDGRLVADVINGRGVERKSPAFNLDRVEILKRFAIDYEQLNDGAVQLSDPTGQKHTLRRDKLGRFAIESSNGVKQWMVFDDRGHLRSQYVGGLAESDWWRTYDYSAAGDLQRVEDSRVGKTEYRYDAAHRLVAELDVRGREKQFAYDSANNLLVQPGLSGVKVGVANQLERTSDEQFEYNARMHMSKRTHIDGTVTEYTYDALDRLTYIRRSDGLDWHAEYDPLDRRIAKQWTAPDGSQHRVEFFWDEHRLAGELTDGKQLRLYIYADDRALSPILIANYDSPTAKPESGRIYHVLHDQRGQPIDVRDSAGTSVWQVLATPYGNVQATKQTDFEMSLRMPGHCEDSETNLFYNRHRYFDPDLGRYNQSDPIGIAGGLNTHAYCCSPMTTVDLEGLSCKKGEKKQTNRQESACWNRETSRGISHAKSIRKQDLFKTEMPVSQRRAIDRFNDPNDTFGKSAKSLAQGLNGKNEEQIREFMAKNHGNSVTNTWVENGQTVVQTKWEYPDGTVFRIKQTQPPGGIVDKFGRRGPAFSTSVRSVDQNGELLPENYRNEAFKVDRYGDAVPKSSGDVKPEHMSKFKTAWEKEGFERHLNGMGHLKTGR